jgi:hypothetical protein
MHLNGVKAVGWTSRIISIVWKHCNNPFLFVQKTRKIQASKTRNHADISIVKELTSIKHNTPRSKARSVLLSS